MMVPLGYRTGLRIGQVVEWPAINGTASGRVVAEEPDWYIVETERGRVIVLSKGNRLNKKWKEKQERK